jgi:histidine triad (HIT) family protein
MLKKIMYFSLSAIVLIGGFFFFRAAPSTTSDYCPFCDPSVLNHQTFYEDELVLGLYTHKPIFPGHCLIIPKKHIEHFDMLSDAEAAHMTQAIKKVDGAAKTAFGISSYILLQKNGREAGQTVPHVHFHYVPRKAGDLSIVKFVLKMFLVNALPPIPSADMEENVQKMRDSLDRDF